MAAAAAVWQLPSCPVGRLVVSSISVDLLPLVALLPGSGAAPAQILDTLCRLCCGSASPGVRARMCHKNVASCVSQKLAQFVACCCKLFAVVLLLLSAGIADQKLLPEFEFPAQRSAPMPCVSPGEKSQTVTKEFSSNSNYSNHKSGRSQLKVRSNYSIF